MITPTFQDIVDAICFLNGFEKHTIILGGEQDLNVKVVERDLKLKELGVDFTDQYVMETYGIKPEHFKMRSEQIPANTQFTALPHQAFSFKASANKLSPEQQEVEELTDAQDELQLLKPDQVKELVFKSDSPESLAYNLMQLIPDATQTQFTANLDQALYAADVLGYVTAQNGK
ncbi:MAG: DUF935 family protein, partial [Acinetobacter sp.]